MDFSLTTLFVLPNGNLVADGFKRENLQPTQFGIFNSRYKAVTTANEAAKSPHIVFGQGRIENVPGLTSKYSDKVSRGSLIEWYKTTGSPVAKTQITYAGWDGVDPSKTLKAGCDEEYSLTIRGRSLYIDTAFAYGLTRTVTVKTPCCEDCGDNCETINPIWLAQEFAKKINENPLLSKFYLATAVWECDTPPADPDTEAVVVYCLTVCDNGDAGSLAAIQAQYPDDVIKFKERVGSQTTYTLTTGAGAPADAVITLPVRLAECDVCPATYTLQEAGDQYIISRNLLPSDDINSAADRQTYANAVKNAYVVPDVFNGASDVGSNQITLTAHTFETAQPVVYSNGGGTSVVGLTSGSTYYIIVVDANTVSLAASPALAEAGTALVLSDGVGAAHSLTLQSSAVFLDSTNGVAKILITVDASADELEALLSDSVEFVGNTEAYCLPPAGTSVAWSACDTGTRTQRSLKLTVANDCGAADLANIQAQYPDYEVTVLATADCVTQYQLDQFSEVVLDGCEGTVPPVFVDVQDYKGLEWEVIPTDLTGAEGCVAGVKIEGKPLDKYGNPCDPIAFPYEFDKLTFEVFAYKGAPTSQDFITYDRCDNIPITKVQNSTFVTGSGDEIFELEKRYHSYQTTMKHIYHKSDYNGAFVRYSNPSFFYDTYVLKFASPDLNTWDNVSRQDETVIFAVPTGTGAALEQFLIGYFGTEKFTAGVLSQSL